MAIFTQIERAIITIQGKNVRLVTFAFGMWFLFFKLL